MNPQVCMTQTADIAAPTDHNKARVVSLRPQNGTMDALVHHVHTSGKFTFDASHARIVAEIKQTKART